jgi:hypothetical protein
MTMKVHSRLSECFWAEDFVQRVVLQTEWGTAIHRRVRWYQGVLSWSSNLCSLADPKSWLQPQSSASAVNVPRALAWCTPPADSVWHSVHMVHLFSGYTRGTQCLPFCERAEAKPFASFSGIRCMTFGAVWRAVWTFSWLALWNQTPWLEKYVSMCGCQYMWEWGAK